MLEVRHLQIVDAIARSGSVTEAARRLHLSQPAVSHALGDLEARLGVSLFERLPRGMRPTPEGDRLVEAAGIVLDAVRDAEYDIRRFREGCQGIVRVATECYTCYHWVPPILAHFAERFPEVEVRIAPEATRDPVAALVAERLDLAIVHNPVEHPDLVTEDLFEDELVALVPPGHPLAGRSAIDPSDFADQVLILHADPDTSAVVTEFLEPAGVAPARVMEIPLTEAVFASVRAGLGLTVVARWVARPETDRSTLLALRLGNDGVVRKWRMVVRRDRARRATLQELARLLKERSGAALGGGDPTIPVALDAGSA